MAMHTWFECKIRYEKTMENGMNKKVTEPYLVDALSFTESHWTRKAVLRKKRLPRYWCRQPTCVMR